jgi:hypothetical protein
MRRQTATEQTWRFRRRALLAGAVLCLAAGCRQNGPGGTPTTQPGRPGYDKDIADAWTVAQSFCEAWKAKDLDAARKLISSRLLERHSEEAFRSTVVGPRNQVHKGFELTGGRKRPDGRVEFDLLLRFDYLGTISDRPETEKSRIVLVQEGGQWRVDEFPIGRVGLGGT